MQIKLFKGAAILYLFYGEGSRPLSRTCPAWGGCMLTVLLGEESSGPENCAGFFYKKRQRQDMTGVNQIKRLPRSPS